MLTVILIVFFSFVLIMRPFWRGASTTRLEKKFRRLETLNLSTNVDRSTDTNLLFLFIFFGGPFFEVLWAILGYFGLLWATFGLAMFGYVWLSLVMFGYFWLLLATLGYFGLLLATLGYFGLHLATFSYF